MHAIISDHTYAILLVSITLTSLITMKVYIPLVWRITTEVFHFLIVL